jgi:type III secretion system export apparatus protein
MNVSAVLSSSLSPDLSFIEGVLNLHAPFLTSLALAYARVAPVCLLLPFFSERIFGGLMVRNAIIFLLLAGLWPALDRMPDPGTVDGWTLAALTCREAVIGTALGMVFSLPFWICSAVGELIDNQRGATISDVFDPSNGVEASSMAAFLSLFSSAAFLANDGMLRVVDALRESYRTLSVATGFTVDWQACISLLGSLMRSALQLSGPVIAALFLTEVLLGVLSRFATQLNPFSLAFAIKSLVAFIVFYVYFGTEMGRWLTDYVPQVLPLVPQP